MMNGRVQDLKAALQQKEEVKITTMFSLQIMTLNALYSHWKVHLEPIFIPNH